MVLEVQTTERIRLPALTGADSRSDSRRQPAAVRSPSGRQAVAAEQEAQRRQLGVGDAGSGDEGPVEMGSLRRRCLSGDGKLSRSKVSTETRV